MYSVVLLMAVTAGGETPDFGRRHGCHGCWGGGYGCCGASYGCCGASYGCCGGASYGCCGGASYGCSGASYGCSGASYGCSGASYGCSGGVPAAPPPPKQAEQVPPPKKGEKKIDDEQVSAPATVVVTLPADASLLVDGKLTQSASSLRTFASPDLKPGQKYAYTFKAEFNLDGKKVSVTKRVPVTAGAMVAVDLTKPAATALASK